MTTLNTMVKRVSGLIDTKDLSDWEQDFCSSVCERTRDGEDTTKLTEKQIECLTRIHDKHFAG